MHHQDVPLTMRHVYERGLTTLSGGNVSMRDADCIWITPSGIDKGALTANDVVGVQRDGTRIGTQRPSSEYPFHQAIYNARADVRVIIHAHVPALVAYCIAHQVPDTRIIAEAYATCGAMGYADYVMPGSPQLGAALADVFATGYQVVLMENHGVVVVGQTITEALYRLETCAQVAQITLHARTLGPVMPVNTGEPDLPPATPSIQIPPEDPHQRELWVYYQRGIERGLFAPPGARLQARLDGHMIDTAPDKQPGTWDARHPYIIEARPLHLMAFAVTHRPLDTRTIPEAYMTVPLVPLVDTEQIAPMLATHDALIVKNNRVIVSGASLLHAYDRLEVLEYTARSIIEAGRLGGVVPMTEEAIRNLTAHYHQYYRGLSG
ncbi:MAG: class II aldolase/adducin family protein [Anaerolineae bacterium]